MTNNGYRWYHEWSGEYGSLTVRVFELPGMYQRSGASGLSTLEANEWFEKFRSRQTGRVYVDTAHVVKKGNHE